ncbi:MAG TPA: ABC transporter substrate-binding protein [Stellaceae bacterium]|jgi:NitT/TauT family transport system substrate-binding protein|nr:ABC transporter substrate-binding protein [Stellaceae bacterium]
MALTITRRDALAGLGAGCVALNIAPARAADLPLVRVSIVPIFAVAAHFAAEMQGYFAEQGIAVSTQPVQGGAVGIPGLVSGSFDVLYANSISCMTALERGIDLRFIAEGAPIPLQPPDPGALLIRKGEALHNGKDFEGKIIGVNAKYDIQWLVMQGWVKKTGGDVSKVTYREVPLPSMLDAIKGKQVDGALVLDPFMTVGLGQPDFERAGWPLSTAMAGLPTSFWIVSASVAEQKHDAIRRYQTAFLKGGKWIDDNLRNDSYNQLVASYTKTDPALIAKMVASEQPLSIGVEPAVQLIAMMKEYGLLKTDIDFKSKLFVA